MECSKQPFRSAAEAKRTMRAQQSRVRKRTGHRTFSGDRVHTYICPNCRLFHIGHRG